MMDTRPCVSTSPALATAVGRRPTRIACGHGAEPIAAAADWLASQPGVSRVAAIGLGLGGLVAGNAIADGAAIDDLVLWGAPTLGRAFLREQRAFAGLQSSALGLSDEQVAGALPEGWLEVGGFVLSADTSAAIGSINLAALPTGRLRRALLLDRDGMRHDRGLEEHLVGQGVDVSTAPGNGWTGMVFHPEQYAPAIATFDHVAAWLDDASGRWRRQPAPNRRSARIVSR